MLHFSLKDGRRLSFWKDPWCSEEVFSLSFPLLFSLAAHKDVRVVEMWDGSRVGGGWFPTFLRALND